MLGADSGDSIISVVELKNGSLSGVGGGTRNFSGVSHPLQNSDSGLLPSSVCGFEVLLRGVIAFGDRFSSEFRNGIDTVTVVPCPGSVFITILPSLSLTNLAATARPRPIDDLSALRHGNSSTS